MRTRHTRKLLAGALGLIVLGCAWSYFAPTSLGGSTTYVVTDGVSMRPRFHTGDLALVRSQSSYHVGEIVAYYNKMLHTIVLHRIVGRDGSRYLFKGDSNNFVDFEHPMRSQLIGALWLHLPGAGAALRSVRSPALVGTLVAIGTLLLTGAAFVRRKRRRGRHRRAGEGGGERPMRPPRQGPAEPVVNVLAIGLAVLCPFVVLALLAFTRATTTQHSLVVPYKQSGTISYESQATPGPTYPGNRAVTGDPLFTHVLNAVQLRFAYLFGSAAKHSLTGEVSLSASITATNGWHTTLELAPPKSFRGDRVEVTAPLELNTLLALVHRVQAATGVSTTSYTLTLLPHVSANAHVDHVAQHLTFSPQIPFSLSELEVQPIVITKSSSATGQPASSVFAPSAGGSVSGRHSQPLYLSFKLARMSVARAREIALGGIAIVVCVLLATLALVRRRPSEASATIRARYGRLIVPVERVWQLPGVAVIDVSDMDALARIAEHYERSILHETFDGVEAFWVTDESGQFRYAPRSGASPASDATQILDAPQLIDARETVDETVGTYGEEPTPAATVPAFESPPAPVALAADPVTERHWVRTHDAHAARDAIAGAPEDLGAGEQAALDGDRAQARAAFASITGLRWTADR
jgi:signal peptidase I